MTQISSDTIFALASGTGRAGVAIYRLSGSLCQTIYRSLCQKDQMPVARMAQRVRLVWQEDHLDDGLVLWFPSPHSFTGEDVLEFQLHGGMAIMEALSTALLSLGARPAEPGEFSKRAFAAGKMDLTQAEAIADLVDAETEAQRRQALRQMDGALARLYDQWRETLLACQAHWEAAIDFSEEDLPEDLEQKARTRLLALAEEMHTHLDDHRQGEHVREGYWISLLGAVNVGKSSILNALAGREAAIVSSHAGTTRDIVEVRLHIGGVPVTLADTAGLREAAEEIEEEGIKRARERASLSDLRLIVLDANRFPDLDKETKSLLEQGNAIVVVNKKDCRNLDFPETFFGCPLIAVSAKTGENMDQLFHLLAQETAIRPAGALPLLTRARHRIAVTQAEEAVRRALHEEIVELAAEDMRMAASAIGRITGRIDVEDVLDKIFGEFCIGK